VPCTDGSLRWQTRCPPERWWHGDDKWWSMLRARNLIDRAGNWLVAGEPIAPSSESRAAASSSSGGRPPTQSSMLEVRRDPDGYHSFKHGWSPISKLAEKLVCASSVHETEECLDTDRVRRTRKWYVNFYKHRLFVPYPLPCDSGWWHPHKLDVAIRVPLGALRASDPVSMSLVRLLKGRPRQSPFDVPPPQGGTGSASSSGR
jgi:hypothetical protein